MKVLYIINSVSMAGATISFINMVKELLKYGVKPIIVIPNTCSLMEESAFLKHFDGLAIKVFKMPVVSLEFKKIHSLFSLRTNLYICKKFLLAKLRGLKSYESLKTIIVQEKPDVIHTNVGPIHVGFHLSQKYNIPHVWHLREYQDLDFDWKIQPTKRIFERMLSMSSVITITKDIFSHFNLDNNPWASVIYNGIFYENNAGYNDKKENYFLICSRISPEKGISDALEAFCLFCKSNADYKMKVLGKVDSDNSYYKDLIAILERNNCVDRVEFLGYKADVKPYMKKAKALVVASHHEGFGRMTAEACFMGCIVIGRDTSGTKEILDYTGGVKYDGSIDDLYQKMVYVSKMNKAEYTSIAVKAMDKAKRKYSIESNAKSIFELYCKLLNKKESSL